MKTYSFLFNEKIDLFKRDRRSDQFVEEIVRYLDEENQDIINVFLLGENYRLETLQYRRKNIVSLFTNQLSSRFLLLFESYQTLKEEYQSLRKQVAFARNPQAGTGGVMGDLVVDASSLLIRLLKIFKNIDQLLEDTSKDDFPELKESIQPIIQENVVDELYSLCIIMQASIKNNSFRITLDEKCQYESIDLIDSSIEHTSIKLGKRQTMLRGDIAYMMEVGSEQALEVIFSFMDECWLFDYCKEEMLFVQFIEKWNAFLTRNGFRVHHPAISMDEWSFDVLIDPYLLMEMEKQNHLRIDSYTISSTYPNQQTVIVGQNNTGKTVFIRSMYLATLFGLAGLYIPGEAATICFVDSIATYFASAENPLSGVGRFEQECMAISSFLDKIGTKTLAIINEPFQTTSTQFGEPIVRNMLEYLKKQNALVFLVTHYTQIASAYQNVEKTSICVYQTEYNNSYQIRKIGAK